MPAVVMGPSGLALTKESEGLRLQAYDDKTGKPLQTGDVPQGTATIGYGHTQGVYPGMICTTDEALQWLVEDLRDAEALVSQHVTVALDEGQADALIDFTFNMGGGRPAGTLWSGDIGKDGFIVLRNGAPSSLLRFTNAGDFEAAALQFEEWDLTGPPGLRIRHRRQRELFQTGTWS